MTARYAIYFAPAAQSPWWDFGSHWLGRDACANAFLVQPQLNHIAPDTFFELTCEPRRYGFHATLKAPFRLTAGITLVHLQDRLHTLAAVLKPVALGDMQAKVLSQFVAMVPTVSNDDLMALASRCVRDFDGLRAPMTTQDLARRQPQRLDEREEALLHEFGYPYVLEKFRFHFTLSGPVSPPVAQQMMTEVTTPIAQLNAQHPLVLDRLCLFVQTAPGMPFQRIDDALLGG